jgi:hypothetical protein
LTWILIGEIGAFFSIKEVLGLVGRPDDKAFEGFSLMELLFFLS